MSEISNPTSDKTWAFEGTSALPDLTGWKLWLTEDSRYQVVHPG